MAGKDNADRWKAIRTSGEAKAKAKAVAKASSKAAAKAAKAAAAAARTVVADERADVKVASAARKEQARAAREAVHDHREEARVAREALCLRNALNVSDLAQRTLLMWQRQHGSYHISHFFSRSYYCILNLLDYDILHLCCVHLYVAFVLVSG